MTIQLSAKLNTSKSINFFQDDKFIHTLANKTTDYLFSVTENAVLSVKD